MKEEEFTSIKHALMFVIFFALFMVTCGLIHGCMAPERAGIAGELRTKQDMSVPAEPKCDGTCRGPESDGCRAIWRDTVYVCRDNGPPNHWWYVQDPEYAGRHPIP
jgi:hypothetical protein